MKTPFQEDQERIAALRAEVERLRAYAEAADKEIARLEAYLPLARAFMDDAYGPSPTSISWQEAKEILDDMTPEQRAWLMEDK